MTKELDQDLVKIKKLLALSKSDNKHEAELAAARAAELMAKHQIDEAELGGFDTDSIEIGEFTVDQAGQITHWRARLALAASKAFGGEFYAHGDRVIDMATGRTKKRVRLQFIGREKDLGGVRYLYEYFCTETRRLADEAWADHSFFGRQVDSARSWKDSFRKGCAVAISNRIYDEREAAKVQSTSTALVKVDAYESAAKDYLSDIDTTTVKPRHTSRSAFEQGHAAGQNVNTTAAGGSLSAPSKQLGGDK